MKRIIKEYSAHLSFLVLVSMIGLLFVLSCEQSTGPGEEITEVTNKLIIYTSRTSMVANRGSASVFAKVYSENDTSKAVSNVQVQFSADNSATISVVNSVTDSAGIARAIVYAGDKTGTVRITAAIQNYSNAAFITVTPDTGPIVPDPSQLPAIIRPGYQTDIDPDKIDNKDGTFTLPISAVVIDANSNGVIDGTTVYFTIDPPEGAVKSPVNTVNSVAQSTITYPYASAGKTITLTASAGGIEGKITFMLPGFTVSYLSITATPKSIPADGKSQTTITATIFDISGSSENVPDGTPISFTTDGGTLDPVVANTKNGVATTVLTSDKNANRYVWVTVKTGMLESTTSIFFETIGTSINQVAEIELTVEPSIITADGSTKATITALLKKFNDEIVTIPTNVMFESNIGTIERYKQSDENGKAVVSFTSGFTGTATITAKVGEITRTATVIIVSGPSQLPAIIRPGYQTDISPDNMDNKDGTFTLPISAVVLDANSNSVADGTTVYFTIDPAEGAVKSPVNTVKSVAHSTITYPYASAGKTITLTASAGEKEGKIAFTLPGFKASYISVSASLEDMNISDDGNSQITIIATILDFSGSSENVPDGTYVSFTTNRGTIDPIVAETKNGVATAELAVNIIADSNVQVKAKTGSLEGTLDLNFEGFWKTVNQVAYIELSVDPSVITADGLTKATITAILKKYNYEIVTIPTNVTFETDIGDIERYKQSDENGKAVASFTSGIVGTATITAKVGEALGTATVIMIPGPPQSVQLSFSPTSVGVQGSGRNETLLITADVKDNKNNPVGDGHLVKFELVGAYDPNSSISPKGNTNYNSAPVPTVNGSARVSFHSGTKSGSVRVKATVVDENGQPVVPAVSSEATQFIVYSAPAYLDMTDLNDPFTESRMTLAGSQLNIYAGELNTKNSQTTITVAAADRYNNPVPEGTAVYFTTTGGYVTTGTGFTDKNGMASVTLFAANPFPTRANSGEIQNPNVNYGGPITFSIPPFAGLSSYYDPDGDGFKNNGFAVVTASTEGVDNLGREVTVWNYVPIIFSMPFSTFSISAVPATPDTLYRGDSRRFEIILQDINGNPVIGGSELTFSSALGKLSHTKLVTNSPGVTRYYVDLANDLDPLTDNPGKTVVTVTLDSPNGKGTVSDDIYMSLNNPPPK